MSEELKWVVTADDKDIIAAFKRMQKELEKAKEKQKELNKESQKGAQDQTKSSSEAIKFLKDTVGGLNAVKLATIGAAGAAKILAIEYQNILDLQNKSAAVTMSTADAQIVFMRNMGNMTAQQARQIQSTVTQVAKANKTTESRIYAIATEAVSSKGSLTDDQMFANIGMASRLAPESQSEAVAIAGALNASTRLTGSADPRENAGLLLGIGEQSRIPSMAKISETMIPSAAGIKATLPGTSTEEAAALFSTLSMLSEDKSGATTGTASLQLAAQLRKYRKGTDLGDEIAKLQNDPKARTAFLKQASFEQKPAPFIEQILTGGTAAAQLYQSNVGKVPSGQTAAEVTDRFFGNLGQSPYQQVAATGRAMDATTAAGHLADQRMAMAGTVGARLTAGMQQAGIPAMQQWGANIAYQKMVAEGRDPSLSGAGILNSFINDPSDTLRKDPKNAEIVTNLQELIKVLKAGSKVQKKNVDANVE